MLHVSGSQQEHRHEIMCLAQRVGENGWVFHILVNHQIAQSAHGHPLIARCDPAQALGAIEIVDGGASRFPQCRQQRRQQLVAERVLQPREAGDESIHSFGQLGVAIQQTRPLRRERDREKPLDRSLQMALFTFDDPNQPLQPEPFRIDGGIVHNTTPSRRATA